MTTRHALHASGYLAMTRALLSPSFDPQRFYLIYNERIAALSPPDFDRLVKLLADNDTAYEHWRRLVQYRGLEKATATAL